MDSAPAEPATTTVPSPPLEESVLLDAPEPAAPAEAVAPAPAPAPPKSPGGAREAYVPAGSEDLLKAKAKEEEERTAVLRAQAAAELAEWKTAEHAMAMSRRAKNREQEAVMTEKLREDTSGGSSWMRVVELIDLKIETTDSAWCRAPPRARDTSCARAHPHHYDGRISPPEQ